MIFSHATDHWSNTGKGGGGGGGGDSASKMLVVVSSSFSLVLAVLLLLLSAHHHQQCVVLSTAAATTAGLRTPHQLQKKEHSVIAETLETLSHKLQAVRSACRVQ